MRLTTEVFVRLFQSAPGNSQIATGVVDPEISKQRLGVPEAELRRVDRAAPAATEITGAYLLLRERVLGSCVIEKGLVASTALTQKMRDAGCDVEIVRRGAATGGRVTREGRRYREYWVVNTEDRADLRLLKSNIITSDLDRVVVCECPANCFIQR